MRLATGLILAGAFVVSECAFSDSQYPSTFPFENEAYIPPDLPARTPSYTYDGEDIGGYLYGVETCSHNACPVVDAANDQFYSVLECCRGIEYRLVTTWALDPVLPMATWNCTLTTAQSDYFGVIDSATVCAAGQCCTEYVGNVVQSLNPVPHHEGLSQFKATGLCETPGEPSYCYFSNAAYTDCYHNTVQPGLHLTVMPCKDVIVAWINTCATYKSIGTTADIGHDPASYLDALTIEQGFTAYYYTNNHVARLCHPYSYYYASSSSNDGGDSSNDGGASSETASLAHSLSVWPGVCLAVFAAKML